MRFVSSAHTRDRGAAWGADAIRQFDKALS